jgi:hypothetical protein
MANRPVKKLPRFFSRLLSLVYSLLSLDFFAQSAIALSCYPQKFHKFLTHFHVKTYNFHAFQKLRIFDTNLQVVGNYRGCFSAPERSMYIVLLKSLAKQENRHPESPLWGEGSVLISPAAGHPHFCPLPFHFYLNSYTSNPQNYKSSPQNYNCSPQKSQKMNEKAIPKPKSERK